MKIELKNITDLVGVAMNSMATFDPAKFNDPVASRTEWGPMRGGGTNFRTHRLVETREGRLEYKASVAAKVIYTVFFLCGLAMLAGGVYLQRWMPIALSAGALAGTFLPGILFTFMGLVFLWRGVTPIVFDRRLKAFWRGRTAPDQVFNPSELKGRVPFDQIHALQIIAEYIKQKSSYYYSYELNLVLKDGSRRNVIDHSNISRIREDAALIADFIGKKPVWDASAGL